LHKSKTIRQTKGKGILLMRRFPVFCFAPALYLILIPAGFSLARMEKEPGELIVVCMIQLEHADAEVLAAVLAPLLSPAGSIAPYRPTNTLIIRDRVWIVEQLAIAIKGIPCTPIAEQPSVETEKEQKEYQLR
jgi:hypothetical protein